MDHQRPSQRRRKNQDDIRSNVRPLRSHPPVVTVNERTARSSALRLARHDSGHPDESTVAVLYAYKHKGYTIDEWAQKYGQSALQHGITPETQHARQRFNELLNYIQGARGIAGMPPISRTSFALVDYADVMFDAITERNEELIREYASKRKQDHDVGNPFFYVSSVLTPLSYRLTPIETRNAKRTWNDVLCHTGRTTDTCRPCLSLLCYHRPRSCNSKS
jgi:hypothetical protein